MYQPKNLASPHCHVESLDSASTPEDFVKRELELGTGAFTCTDHGFLGACRDVYRLAKANSLIPILGIEAYHRDDNCKILKDSGIYDIKGYYKYGHLLIHAKDQEAYEAIVKKTSVRDLTAEQHGSERKPIFTWQDLEELGAYNTTMSSGCLIGIVGKHLMGNRPDIAVKYYERLRSIARPGNFMVEIFPHRCDKNWVSAVFVKTTNKDHKFYLTKKLRTEAYEEITAADLSKEFKKGKDVGKLIAIKSRSGFEEIEPSVITGMELVQDFIANECTADAPDGDIQLRANKFVLELARKYGDKVYISDDAHYASPESKIVQDAKLGGMGDSFRFYGNYHRHSGQECYDYFSNYMGMSEAQFDALVENNQEWVQGFKDFKLENKPSLPGKFYPADTKKYALELIEKHGRMDWNNPVKVARLEQELKLFHDNGVEDLLPYFFLAEESVDEFAKRKVITGVGRGSSAGVQLNYLLETTHADPFRFNLSLDRFMTKDRIESGKWPDIDMDLPDVSVLTDPKTGMLERRFSGHWAQIGTKNLLRVKSAIKDVARYTWGEVPQEIEVLTATIPSAPQGVEDLAFLFGYKGEDEKEVKGLFEEHKGLQEYAKKYPKQWELVLRMVKTKRSNGRHASGYAVTNRPIDEFIPLHTINGSRCTQYDAKSVEEAGAVKMDYLGLNSLKDIQGCIQLIQKNHVIEEEYRINNLKVHGFRVVPFKGQMFDVWDLPQDPEVFIDICERRTETVFQFSTASAQKWLKAFDYWKPEGGNKLIASIEDMATFTALDRPGPLDATVKNDSGTERNMLQEYAARLRGNKPIGEIPYLTEHLAHTMGVICMQEDLTAVYKSLTGCSGIEAEAFRSDIGKKKMAKVIARYPGFMETASKQVSKEEAQAIWDQIVTFGQYGFNLSHAICYGITAYVCAFLKHHYPLEWWCSVLQNADKEEVAEKFWKHCKHLVTMPDLRYSNSNFCIENGKIIAPLSLLKGIGPKAHDQLIAFRPIASLSDLCNKIVKFKVDNPKIVPETGVIKPGKSAVHRGVIGTLIVAGVMDSFFEPGLDLVSKLELFNKELAFAENKKRPEKINPKWANFNSLNIYHERKEILPIYSEYLAPRLYDLKFEGVEKREYDLGNGRKIPAFIYNTQDGKNISWIMESMNLKRMFKPIPFLNGKVLRETNLEASIEEGKTLRVAVAGYVMECEKFNYKDKKTGKTLAAAKLLMDVDGEVIELVKWPDFNTKKTIFPSETLTGHVIVAIISKYREDRPYQLDTVVKVQAPVED